MEPQASTSATELILLKVWSQVLDVEPITATDNFFDLGGHSLLALRIVSRIRAELKVDLSPGAIFAAPTVRALAAVLDSSTRHTVPSTPQLRRLSFRSLYRPSLAQERMYHLTERPLGPRRLTLHAAYELHGTLQVSTLEKSIQAVIDRHDILRTSFEEVNGQLLLRVHPQLAFKLTPMEFDAPTSRQRHAQSQRWLRRQVGQEFDRHAIPLFHIDLLSIDDQHYVLLIMFDHLIADGWSLDLFVKQVSEAYNLRSRWVGDDGSARPQFSDWAEWHRELLSGAHHEEIVRYWRSELGGTIDSLGLKLPWERYRGSRIAAHPGDKGEVSLNLSVETTQGMRALARRLGVTLYAVGLSSLARSLALETDQSDITFLTTFANREHAGTQDMIGCLCHDLLIRITQLDTPEIDLLITQVHHTILRALEHGHMPASELQPLLWPDAHGPYYGQTWPYYMLSQSWDRNLHLRGIEVQTLELYEELPPTSGIDFWFTDRGSTITLYIAYDRSRYPDNHVARLSREIVRQLERWGPVLA